MTFKQLVVSVGVLGSAAITAMALYANAQPVKRAPMPIKVDPNVKYASTVANCPDTGPRQHCKQGDTCVAVDAKKKFYDCMKAGSKTEKYPALATCGIDRECKSSETCVAGRCVLATRASDAPRCNGGSPCRGTLVCGRQNCSCDVDRDGHENVDCGGDDCDDNDHNRFPGNPEVCMGDRHAKDEDCNPLTVANASWENTASIPYWLVNTPEERKFADQDNDGAISSHCSNPWITTAEPYGSMPGRKVIFATDTRTIHGNDCRDTETGYTSARTPMEYCEGRELVVCGFEPGEMDRYKRLGFAPRGFLLVKQCPRGCIMIPDGRGSCS
jgi:hypothetical protein